MLICCISRKNYKFYIMNIKEICRNRIWALLGMILLIILNALSFWLQGLQWFSILVTSFNILSSIFTILDICEITCCKKEETQASLKDRAQKDLDCREKRANMYKDLETGDDEEIELLNNIKNSNQNEQIILAIN